MFVPFPLDGIRECNFIDRLILINRYRFIKGGVARIGKLRSCLAFIIGPLKQVRKHKAWRYISFSDDLD